MDILSTIVLFTAISVNTLYAAPTHDAIIPQPMEITEYVSDIDGCYYNFQRYEEGDRIITNEPCLNCTCHDRMLMCYLKVCPFSKPIGQDCTVEKSPDQCCPVITCPEVPVKLLTTSTTAILTSSTTEIINYNNYGCSTENGIFYADGVQVPSHPTKPCELCYCIRNHTACVMQECTLQVEGCKPVYQNGICCPVRYDCDYEKDVSVYFGGLIRSTTSAATLTMDCRYSDKLYSDGELITTKKPCEHCYCMRGDIVCAVQDCGQPLHEKDCVPTAPPPEQCCPSFYECANETYVTKSIIPVTQSTKMVESTVNYNFSEEHLYNNTNEIITIPNSLLANENDINYQDNPYQKLGELINDSTNNYINLSNSDYVSDNIIAQESIKTTSEEKKNWYTTGTNIIGTTNKITPEEGFSLYQPSEESTTLRNVPSVSQQELFFSTLAYGTNDILNSMAYNDSNNSNSDGSVDSAVKEKDKVNSQQFVVNTDKYGLVTNEFVHPEETSEYSSFSTISETQNRQNTLLAQLESNDVTSRKQNDEIFITKLNILLTDKLSSSSIGSTESIFETSTQSSFIAAETIERHTESLKDTDKDKTSTNQKNDIELSQLPNNNADISTTKDSELLLVSTNGFKYTTIKSDVDLITTELTGIPGEGSCLTEGKTYSNESIVPTANPCHHHCICKSSIIVCTRINCSSYSDQWLSSNNNQLDCIAVLKTIPGECCPVYTCGNKETDFALDLNEVTDHQLSNTITTLTIDSEISSNSHYQTTVAAPFNNIETKSPILETSIYHDSETSNDSEQEKIENINQSEAVTSNSNVRISNINENEPIHNGVETDRPVLETKVSTYENKLDTNTILIQNLQDTEKQEEQSYTPSFSYTATVDASVTTSGNDKYSSYEDNNYYTNDKIETSTSLFNTSGTTKIIDEYSTSVALSNYINNTTNSQDMIASEEPEVVTALKDSIIIDDENNVLTHSFPDYTTPPQIDSLLSIDGEKSTSSNSQYLQISAASTSINTPTQYEQTTIIVDNHNNTILDQQYQFNSQSMAEQNILESTTENINLLPGKQNTGAWHTGVGNKAATTIVVNDEPTYYQVTTTTASSTIVSNLYTTTSKSENTTTISNLLNTPVAKEEETYTKTHQKDSLLEHGETYNLITTVTPKNTYTSSMMEEETVKGDEKDTTNVEIALVTVSTVAASDALLTDDIPILTSFHNNNNKIILSQSTTEDTLTSATAMVHTFDEYSSSNILNDNINTHHPLDTDLTTANTYVTITTRDKLTSYNNTSVVNNLLESYSSDSNIKETPYATITTTTTSSPISSLSAVSYGDKDSSSENPYLGLIEGPSISDIDSNYYLTNISTDNYPHKEEENINASLLNNKISMSTEKSEYSTQYLSNILNSISSSTSFADITVGSNNDVVSNNNNVQKSTWNYKPYDIESTSAASNYHPEEGNFPSSESEDYDDEAFGPGTCRYGGKIYVSAQQIPREDPCDFCFCFRSDIICLQQSCPPPIHGCLQETIQGFCCPRYECPVPPAPSSPFSSHLALKHYTTTSTLPPHHFLHKYYRDASRQLGCNISGYFYKVGDEVTVASGPCLKCICGNDGNMKCDPKSCSPQSELQQMMAQVLTS